MPFNHSLKANIHFPLNFKPQKIKISEDASLYLTNTMRIIGISIVGIFLPIYIYRISESFLYFSNNEVINGISWVLSYFLLQTASFLHLPIDFLHS